MSFLETSRWKFERSTKVAVLVPCRDRVDTIFTQSLVEMVKTSTRAGLDIHVVYDSSTILLNQRENLAQAALDMNADYMLWLDSDMMFPSTTAIRLISHHMPVVAANYMKRSPPLTTVAYEKIGDWDSWVPLDHAQELVSVEGVGMGVFCMETAVLEEIPKPWFRFEYENGSWHGEDFAFQKLLRAAGFNILVDMNLSRQVRHIGQWAFGPSIGTNDEQIIKRRVQ